MIIYEDEHVRVAALRGRVTIFDKHDELDRVATDDEAERYWDLWTRRGEPRGQAEAQQAGQAPTHHDDG